MSWRTDMVEREHARKRREQEEREAQEMLNVHGADWQNKSMEFLLVLSDSGSVRVTARE